MTGHFEALEASFAATYEIDFRRALWGKTQIGVRRIVSLISGLPPGSPLHRSLDPEAWAWGPQEEFLASCVELLDTIARLFWQANFKGSPPGRPVEITRPERASDRHAHTPPARISGTTDDLKEALAAEGRLLEPATAGGDHGG